MGGLDSSRQLDDEAGWRRWPDGSEILASLPLVGWEVVLGLTAFGWLTSPDSGYGLTAANNLGR